MILRKQQVANWALNDNGLVYDSELLLRVFETLFARAGHRYGGGGML